ncbi:hypothetical protein [Aquisediminimonas profunda]|uniref:hypothetical protein n=1 Tax=Aquisediminimonas profunda TaxID=1550733 RepID=UPI001C62B4D5|nr:hypothetical protein [Aquisediminimonas profunda]
MKKITAFAGNVIMRSQLKLQVLYLRARFLVVVECRLPASRRVFMHSSCSVAEHGG